MWLVKIEVSALFEEIPHLKKPIWRNFGDFFHVFSRVWLLCPWVIPQKQKFPLLSPKFSYTTQIKYSLICKHVVGTTNKYIYICCTLRSGLHVIPKMIRTFPHGLENNHSCNWICDNFPGMLTYVLFLENFLKYICMHRCSPIHVERSFFFLKVWHRFVC